MSKKRWLNGLLAGLAVGVGLAVAAPLVRHHGPAAPGPEDSVANANGTATATEFCDVNAAEARVTPADTVDRHYRVEVSVDAPPMGMPSASVHSIAKGEVVEFEVASPRPGQVAVHGLRDAETVHVGGVVKVAFRAVYTGRFPLHFHGVDGSHFEIAALEVLPKAMVAARSGGQPQ